MWLFVRLGRTESNAMQSVLSSKRTRLAALAAGAQASASPRPEVGVTAMEAWAVRSSSAAPARLILALRTDAGITGYGESSAEPDPASAVSRVLRYKTQLVGRDAMGTESARLALAAAPPEVRGAVDIALLDIKGKITKAPIYDLLSGRTRDKARAMAAVEGETEAELIDAIAAARGDGYRAFSVPVLLPRGTPTRGRKFFTETEALLENLRRAGADDLALDCGGRTTAAEGAGLAARLQGFHLMWMDEPSDQINDEALKKISHETVTPVGWGRRFTSNDRFQDLLRLQVIDVVRPDVGLNGISSIRRAAALAEAYYTAIAPFHRGGPIGAAAALQIAASVPNFVVQEVAFPSDKRQRKMNEEIADGAGLRVTDGFFELPTGPGLGIEVNEDALRRYSL